MTLYYSMTPEQIEIAKKCPVATVHTHNWGTDVFSVVRVTKKYIIIACNDIATIRYHREPRNNQVFQTDGGNSKILNWQEIEEFVTVYGKDGLWNSGWRTTK